MSKLNQSNDYSDDTIFDHLIDSLSPDVRLWYAVIERMIVDYAFFYRMEKAGRITNANKCHLSRLHDNIFNYSGALSDILKAISDQPEYVADKIRAILSSDFLTDERILGRKMREFKR